LLDRAKRVFDRLAALVAVAPRDQVQFEIAAAYRHYHAALMYVILTGEPDPRHRHMFDACAEALV
jgi:Xaa-Pro dipeptidase